MSRSKTIVFTGATSGLGEVAALKALSEGNKLVILARNPNSHSELETRFKEDYPDLTCNLETIHCDLSHFSNVKSAIKEIKEKYESVDMLVNNAGMWNTDFNETQDGIEETFQVNYLVPIMLLDGLIPLLLKGNDPKYIVTSSGLHQGTINFDDIEYRKKWSGFKAYRQSKLAVILMCRQYAEKYPSITFCSQHPGVVRTSLGRQFGWFSRAIFFMIGKTATKGAKTLIHLIESPTKNLVSGEYYANEKVTKITKESNDMFLAKKLRQVADDYLKEITD